jgi:SAM-dependent methyltransferase
VSTTSDARAQAAVLARAERFFDSVAVFSLHRAGVFAVLSDGPATLAQLSSRLQADTEALEALLNAAVALDVLQRSDGRYHADADMLRWLGGSEDDGLGPWLRFLEGVAGAMLHSSDALALRRVPEAFDGVVTEGGGPGQLMSRAMSSAMRGRGVELAERLPLDDVRHFIDLGCGGGELSAAILSRAPQTTATLVDFGQPLSDARNALAARGLEGRAHLVEADIRSWPTSAEPASADLVIASNVLHMIGPAEAVGVVNRSHGILRPGGRMVIQGQLLDPGETSPRWAALANLILVASTPEGRNHTTADARAWLEGAGFVDVEPVGLSLFNANSALVGRAA